MQVGTELERLALAWAAEELGQAVTPHDQSVSLVHPEHDMIRCTPDGYAEDGWLVEAKVTGEHPWKDVPLHYLVQVQHQLAVTGAPGAYIVQVSRHRLEVTVHAVERHDGTIARLERELPAWWQRHVVDGEPPEPTTLAEVVKIHPEPEGTVELDDSIEALATEIKELQAEANRIKGEIEERKALIAMAMGDAEVGLLPSGMAVTFRATEAKEYTVKRKASRTLRVLVKAPK
jgi:predicted phage-related endonuclease